MARPTKSTNGNVRGNGRGCLAEGYKIEFDNINQRITTIADVFNASIGEMRTDFRALDTRIHALLEEGVISSLRDRVTAIEQCVHSIPERNQMIDQMRIELIKIDQRVAGLMWAVALTIGPAVAYLVTTWLMHMVGGNATGALP